MHQYFQIENIFEVVELVDEYKYLGHTLELGYKIQTSVLEYM